MARKQLAAYLIISALAGSVSTVGAPSRAYSAATRSAASGWVEPTTIRSGFRKSRTALPSRRNSGLLTTAMSGRSSRSAVRCAVPTGTVDLFTSTAPAGSIGRSSSTTASTADRSAMPPTPIGVGTHRNTTCTGRDSAASSASAAPAPTTKLSRPAARPSATSSASPASWMPISPARRLSILRGSRSAHTTRCPSDARHAPVVNPT